MNKSHFKILNIVTLAFIFSNILSPAEVIKVPSDFYSIQSAINASRDGDEIIVSPKKYFENLQIKGKNIILRSNDPTSATVVSSTIINGGGHGNVITFSGEELTSCVLSGFTITNGFAEMGSGILGNHTLATIERNNVTGNKAYKATFPYGVGGGIAQCHGSIKYNTFSNNTSSYGGGLYWCEGEILDNNLTDNTGCTIADCKGRFAGNVLKGNKNGAISKFEGIIENNDISNNSGYIIIDCKGSMQNNIVAFNSGIAFYKCNGNFANNVVWGNHSESYAAGLTYCTGEIKNCIIWANISEETDFQIYHCSIPSYSCIEDWCGAGEGNISGDPFLVNPENGNFRLSKDSSCLDAGCFVKDMEFDLEGYPRPFDSIPWGPRGDGSDFDMGAYEFQESLPLFPTPTPSPTPTPTPTPSNVEGLIVVPSDYHKIQDAIDAAEEGDEIVVYPATYFENLLFSGKNIVLRSIDPTSPSVVSSTIIHGSYLGNTVSFSGDELTTCILSGLTITGGSGVYGAGICGGTWEKQTQATIEFNIIEENVNLETGGGGISLCNGKIIHNVVQFNQAAGTAGIYACNGEIVGNIIRGNHSITTCGGIRGCNGTIINNLIVYNKGQNAGGIAECRGIIQNNTIAYNTSNNNYGGIYKCEGVIRNCIIWGNIPALYYPLRNGDFCFYEDPIFENPELGDFHLKSNSPCIDKGVSGYWEYKPCQDLDRNCRLIGECVDIGCYEFGSSPDTDGDFAPDNQEISLGTRIDFDDTDGDGIIDGLELIRNSDPLAVTSPGILNVPSDFSTIQMALAVSTKGDEIVVQPGTYLEEVRIYGPDVILRGADPLDITIVNSTIIDGDNRLPVVRFSGGESSSFILTGFKITHGHTDILYSGGIDGKGTLATITHCIITDNNSSVVGGIRNCNGLLMNNIISYNFGSGTGGLYNCQGRILHNTIYENNSYQEPTALSNCNGVVRNCIIWQNTGKIAVNTTPAFCCISNWTGGGEGNFSQDPLLSPDFHLLPQSPCIDSGGYADSTLDFEGNQRPYDAGFSSSRGDGSGFDIGADEFIGNAQPSPTPSPTPTPTPTPSPTPSPTPYPSPTPMPSPTPTLLSEILYVPLDHGTIQEAINASTDSQVILVLPGEYKENIKFKGKNIVLQSLDPKNIAVVEQTIIDGGQAGSVVTFSGKENESCMISGFIIRNGKSPYGAGICGNSSRAEVLHNIIEDNHATVTIGMGSVYGAGIYGCNGRIMYNIIRNNIASVVGYAFGGGICSCNGLISNNIIYNNIAQTVDYYSRGGGLYECNGIIQNNVILNNEPFGLCDCKGEIRNCIIWGNTAGYQVRDQMLFSSNPIFCCIQKWGGDGIDNITSEPLFIDTEGGYFQLRDDSPCIDAGDPYVYLNDTCFPPGKGGDRGDMGAYGGPHNCGWEINAPRSALAVLTQYGDIWGAACYGISPFDRAYCRASLNFKFDPNNRWSLLKGDVDGKGLEDPIQITEYGDAWVSLNIGPLLQMPSRWGWLGFHYDEKDGYYGWQPLCGDVDGNGSHDMIQVTEYGDAWAALSDKDSFTTPTRWGWLGYRFHRAASGENGALPLSGDVNGDGLCDLIQVTEYTDAWAALSTGSQFETPTRWGWLGFKYAPFDGWNPLCGDVNADGKDDLVQITPTGDPWVAISNGSSFDAPTRWGWLGFYYNEEQGHYPMLGDVNSDGMEDLIQVTPEGMVWVALSLGDQFDYPEYWGSPGFLFSRENGYLPFFLDF